MAGKDAFDPQVFIDQQIREVKRALGGEKAIIACSGGVDSTTCALLTRKAIGENLVCIFIDTGFMRLDEPEEVIKTLSSPPMSLPVKLIQAKEKFLKALKGLEDAEEKRKAFRSTFYSILQEAAKEENCHFLVQGTILPDVVETVKGIKTQHNVLEQMKIDTKKVYGFKLVEPLVSLYKFQVREVARRLGMPLESSERQPFPGPGLSVRVVGEIISEKLDVEKKATKIVEKALEKVKSKQYFPATIDSAKARYLKIKEVEEAIADIFNKKGEITVKAQVLKTRATGIKTGRRQYGKIVLVNIKDKNGRCVELSKSRLHEVQKRVIMVDDEVTRVLYKVTDLERDGRWITAIRAVDTEDFMTAKVTNIPWKVLKDVGTKILDSCHTAAVYFDITPKPPASIEFE